jgi:hypothetical protein
MNADLGLRMITLLCNAGVDLTIKNTCLKPCSMLYVPLQATFVRMADGVLLSSEHKVVYDIAGIIQSGLNYFYLMKLNKMEVISICSKGSSLL